MKRSELKQLIREVVTEMRDDLENYKDPKTINIKAFVVVNPSKILNDPSLTDEQEINIEAEASESGEPKIYSIEDVMAYDQEGNNTSKVLFRKDQPISLSLISPTALRDIYDAIDHKFSQM